MHSLRRSSLGRVLKPGALVAAAGLISACSASGAPSGVGDDSNAQEDGVRVCAAGATVDGVDVSVHNGHIDWAKVKAAGKTFAIARVSYGSQHDDTEFPANWSGIKAAGLVPASTSLAVQPDAVVQADLLLAGRRVRGRGPAAGDRRRGLRGHVERGRRERRARLD